MSRQYDRVYDLTIENIDGTFAFIKDLQVRFEVTKTLLGIPNSARIDIYNLSEKTRANIQTKLAKVTLNAGYKGNSRLIFSGQIRNIFDIREKTDRVTTIYAADGERDWRDSRFNKTLSENITLQSAVEQLAATFTETSVGELNGLSTIPDKLRGQTLSGSTKDILDMFADEYGFEWSIQDGVFVTEPIDIPLQADQAVLITPATGMINAPTITEIGANVTTLLNPLLVPNGIFKIESTTADLQLGNLFIREARRTEAEGFYKVQEVKHTGNSRAGEWNSIVSGRVIND